MQREVFVSACVLICKPASKNQRIETIPGSGQNVVLWSLKSVELARKPKDLLLHGFMPEMNIGFRLVQVQHASHKNLWT